MPSVDDQASSDVVFEELLRGMQSRAKERGLVVKFCKRCRRAWAGTPEYVGAKAQEHVCRGLTLAQESGYRSISEQLASTLLSKARSQEGGEAGAPVASRPATPRTATTPAEIDALRTARFGPLRAVVEELHGVSKASRRVRLECGHEQTVQIGAKRWRCVPCLKSMKTGA